MEKAFLRFPLLSNTTKGILRMREFRSCRSNRWKGIEPAIESAFLSGQRGERQWCGRRTEGVFNGHAEIAAKEFKWAK
jgi:hypothetical protein